MKGSNMDSPKLFIEPKETSCLIITLSDTAILQLLEDKEIYIGDTFNTIIIKYIGDIK